MKLDGGAGDLADGEGGPAAGVGVELGEDYAVELEPIVKRLRRVDRVLPGHRVDHEQHVVRAAWLSATRLDLAHQLVVDVQPTRGVEDEDVAARRSGRDAARWRRR